ncbi:MAG: glycoside hydrolase family 2 [Saprospiraceae bacterium]|nr:glycoside hydrolase family 2 [Saprospiraceae bacterium]
MTLRTLPIFITLFLVLQLFVAAAQPSKWKPVPGTMTTPWTEKVNPANPLPEYPRPAMFRQDWANLNGLWNLQMIEIKTGKPVKQSEVLVPYPVESALSGCGWRVEPDNSLVYSRKLTLPERWQGQRILLHFGACDWRAQVSINGKKIGEHKGGYDAFVFDITDHIRVGKDAILSVQVDDPSDRGHQAVGKQHLNPSGIWYTPTSGIWQTVWMEPVPQTFIKSYRVEPQPEKNRAIVRVATEGNMDGLKVVARVRQGGQVITEATGKPGAPLMIFVKNTRLWSPEDPFLYELDIQLEDAKGKATDKVRGYFGMRSISVGPDEKGVPRMLLNGKPVFQLGPLDQGFWPDGLYTPATEEAVLYDLTTLKSLGFNMIRKHVKVELARWYYHCDRMGFLVWQDMPSGNPVSEEDKTQFRWEMKAMVDQLANHPSIVMWVPFNEGWGQHDTPDYVEKMKEWDPTRLVNNASGWTDAGVGDVLDIHDYPGPKAPKPTDGRVGVLGEFGGLGLNVAGHQWSKSGWGYQQIETPEALLERYEELYRELWPMVQGDGLSATVYTQVSDVETEVNGLMTYDRKVLKMDSNLVKLTHRGQMPPKPVGEAPIFIKNTTVELATAKQGATIEYAIETNKGPLTWMPYSAPIPIKTTTAVACRATWPDGAKSREQRYLISKTKPMKPKGKTGKAAGLKAKIYSGSWDKLPDFAAMTPVNELNVNDLSLKQIDLKEDFGVVFEGWVEVPATGVYSIHMVSDDGSRLIFDEQKLIEMDGLHGMVDRLAHVALKKGRHPLRLEFFQKKGGVGLEFWLENEKGNRMTTTFGH